MQNSNSIAEKSSPQKVEKNKLAQHPMQADLFAQAEQSTLKTALTELDLDNMTPLDAMNTLYKLRSQL